MQYLLMIYNDPAKAPIPGTPEHEQYIADYRTFTQELVDDGVMQGGNALMPVTTAKSVRVREQSSTVTDGPFAETKEMLGGYYLIDCESEEKATAYAAKIPTAKTGTIEVRAILDY